MKERIQDPVKVVVQLIEADLQKKEGGIFLNFSDIERWNNRKLDNYIELVVDTLINQGYYVEWYEEGVSIV